LHQVRTFLGETAARALPRILTQISRDPQAAFYGACDRDWWHYKTRDFPSVILQQAGYALAIAADCQPPIANRQPPTDLLPLAAASARFWNQRAILHGAFEEYYPYEQGYPPLAFSTLSIAKLCYRGIVPLSEIQPGLVIAVRQLLARFEVEAANQQIAGTAALSVIRSLDPSLVTESAFQKILTETLALQHDEGWFPEYDGPDLGYLSVSIDCLWDILDQTQDPRLYPAIVRAAEYTAWFALNPLGAAGMHNSRNTDYFVPYGLVRLALEENDPRIAETVHRLFTRPSVASIPPAADAPPEEIKNQQSSIINHQSPSPAAFHPFDALDDRYWCHYIGHSVFRALILLEKAQSADRAGSALPPPPPPPPPPPANRQPPTATTKSGSGHALLTSLGNAAVLVSTRKGAIASAIWPDDACANDFGWIVQTPQQLCVTHWWSNAWTVNADDQQASSEGHLVSHQEHLSSPWKHIVLRIGSFLLGKHLIRILKRLVIFKKPQQSLHFSRTVSWENESLVIHDRITGVSDTHSITRAPRSSKRHVASADCFHPQDFEMLRGVDRLEKIKRSNGVFTCETRYRKAVGGERLAAGD
jgi:hypothetical protein